MNFFKKRGVRKKLTIYGTLYSNKPPKTLKNFYRTIGIFAILIAAFFLIAGFISINDIPTLIGLFIIIAPLILLGIFLLTIPKKIDKKYDEFMRCAKVELEKERKEEELKAKKEREERDKMAERVRKEREQWAQDHPHFEAEEFYKKMRTAGFSSLDSEYSKEKMLLYIKNHNIKAKDTAEEIIEFFNIGKIDVERLEHKEYIEKLRKEEINFISNSIKYAKGHGFEKTKKYYYDKIAPLETKVNQCKIKAEEAISNGSKTISNLKTPEHDWAIHGGIASGIAGPAAGLATALKTQAENQKIREYNQNIQSLMTYATYQTKKSIDEERYKAEKEIEELKAQLENSRNKLRKDLSPKMLLEQINPQVSKVKRSETGALKFNLKVEPPKDLVIISDTPALVDGYFRVYLNDINTGEQVASTICVLPVDGLSEKMVFECICIDVPGAGCKFNFAFAPIDLWAIEK